MHIVIAPNAFKGSLSAQETANAIAEGIRKSKLKCRMKLVPIADGGDGTAALIAQKMKAEKIITTVHDPLGRKIEAGFAWAKNKKTAIIEMSDASGLRLIKKEELDPLHTNTRGTGELISAALDKGAKKLLIGVGGSATVDGATGALHALGIRFLNKKKKEIIDLPLGLMQLESIDTSKLDPRLKSCEITVLSDVKNTLLGDNGAAPVFGPQKGATKKEVALLEKCLHRFNEITQQTIHTDMSSMMYGGAAGGMAAGLAAFLQAKLVSGIEFFLDVFRFDQTLEKADLLITAEGSLDAQTMEGKGPYGVACRAKNKNIPVIALAGQVPFHIENKMRHYFDAILPIAHAPSSIEQAIQNTAADLKRTCCELGNVLAISQK